MTQLLPALMRTLVPAIYGWLIHLGLSQEFPQKWATDVISVVVLGLVYLALRLLEHHQQWVGILLGWIGAPQYADVVEGEVLDATDAVETLTRDDLAALRDDVVEAVAAKIGDTVPTLTPEAADNLTKHDLIAYVSRTHGR